MIIFLYGEDGFRSSRKLAEIKNKFTEKNKEGGTLFVFDFQEEDFKAEDLVMKLASGGLFSEKKLAILKSALQNKKMAESEALLEFLKKHKKEEDKDLTLIFWEQEKLDKKNKLVKFLLANSNSQEFTFISGGKLHGWIKEEIKAKSGGKVGILPAAVERLASFVGPEDLQLLDAEMEKLVNYKGTGEISETDIDSMVKSRINTDIFKTIDALSGEDKSLAMEYLHNHLNAGDDPFYLLSMYFFQFRNLLKVKPLLEKNIMEHEIAGKLKLHPFVVKKSAMQGRNFSLARLTEIYKNLCELDYAAKTGKVEIGLALDKFISTV